MNLDRLLEIAIDASYLAGIDIMDVYDKPVAVDFKEDRSPLTEADRRAHHTIAKALDITSYPVLSEEGKHMPYEERKNWELFWMVDPVDGTKEFIKRNGEFTVNIALIKNQEPLAGVVYAPVLNLLYFASAGRGSFRTAHAGEVLKKFHGRTNFLEELISISRKLDKTSLPAVFTVVASRSHMSPETEQLISSYREKNGQVELISKGSSLKLCLVAEGSAHVYPRLAPTMEWDTAAGHAIVKFAGKSVNLFKSGLPMPYNKENLLNEWFIVE